MDCRTLLRHSTCTIITIVLASTAVGCGNPTHPATGEVVAIDLAEEHVTINHDDIAGVMPAMTMQFRVQSPGLLAGIAPGMPVRFVLEQRQHDLIIRRIEPAEAARRARPGIHDHTPHHGGVVTMIGMRHLEATATPDGQIRVYLTDAWRRPLPPDGWHGTATLDSPDGRRDVALSPMGDAVEGHGPALEGDSVIARIVVSRSGERTLEMHPVLPLRDHIAGAAAVPVDACSPPALPAGHAGRLPRCTLQFPESITALATTPDATALIAVEGGGVTTWQLPTAAFVRGFAPPPSIAGPADEAPHRDAPSTIAVSPDGRQAIVVIEGRLLRYATATGRLLRELPGPGGVVQSVAWSPDGGTLLVTAFYDTDVRLVSADDGAEIRRLVVEREGTAVGFTADGHGGLVGTGAGTIMLFSLDENVPPRLIEAVGRPLHALTVVGDRVASSGNDGILHLVAIATGKSLATSEPGSPCYRLALAPDAEVIACAGYDRVIRLYRVESAELIETLAWHEGPIAGLAWSGTTLLSGDVAGSLALWDLAQVIQEASRP